MARTEISQFNAAMESCAASRQHIETSRQLIEASLDALTSSKAMLARTIGQIGKVFIASYDVHFVDHGGHVFDAIVVDGDTDTAAIEDAHSRDVPSIGAGFDIWRGDRLVHQHRR